MTLKYLFFASALYLTSFTATLNPGAAMSRNKALVSTLEIVLGLAPSSKSPPTTSTAVVRLRRFRKTWT